MNDTSRSARCWKFECWPACDRAAWRQNTSPGDPFDDRPYGAFLRPASLRKTSKGYGRWLAFLDAQGWLDPEAPPLQRITHCRLRTYFRALKAAGNADYTIVGRFAELARAMRILAPGTDVGWIQRPGGITIDAMLQKTTRPMIIPDVRVLFNWGLKMMNAQMDPLSPGDPIGFRDGLLIAMLAARGRRLGSMARLRVQRELVLQGTVYRIELTPEQTKTHVHDRFDLPDLLTPYVRHYLLTVRPALLADRQNDAVWISARGAALTTKGIAERILKLSRARFGVAFGPHRSRHAIATSSVLRDPANPGLAAGVLGGSAKVIEKHYNRAGQIHAASQYAKIIAQRRQKLSNGDAEFGAR